MNTRRLANLLLASIVSLTSCSGSGSGSAPGTESDLPGVWKVWTIEENQPEVGPAALYLSLAEAVISGADISGKIEGSTFRFTAAVQGGTSDVLGHLDSPHTASGTYTTTKNSGKLVKGTFRMEKFNPAGSVSVRGKVFGTDISHDATNAVGIRKYLDQTLTALAEAEIVTGTPGLSFELDFDPRNLQLGVLAAGTGATDVGVAVEFSTGLASARAVAIGGTIIVTRFDFGGLKATFNLNLESGDTVSGSIDVAFDLHAFHPFGV